MRSGWLLAAALLAAGGGLAGCAGSSQPSSTVSSSAQSPPASPAATTDVSRRDVTQQLVTTLLAEMPLPPGATAEPTSPASILSDPGATEVSTNLVQAFGWYVVPGTEQSVLAFETAHPLPGFVGGGTGHGSGPGFTEEDEQFTGAETADHGPPIIDVEVTAQGDDVAVRVNVGAIWRPVRTAAEQVPGTVTSATAELLGAEPARTIQLDQADAHRLAAEVNGLDVELPAEHSCPATDSTKRITFSVGGQQLVFDVGSCGGVAVTAGGASQPTLAEYTDAGTSPLVDELNALFGIVSSPVPSISMQSEPASSPPARSTTPTPTPTPSATPGTGTLTGRALMYGGPATASGGQALNGAPGQGVTVKVLKNGALIASEVTGPDGTFTFQLPPGSYQFEGCEQTTVVVSANSATVHDLMCAVP